MKLKNFNWDEQAIDQIVTDDTRYTTYNGYASHDYHIEATPQVCREGESILEELTVL